MGRLASATLGMLCLAAWPPPAFAQDGPPVDRVAASCLAGLRRAAVNGGVRGATFDSATSGLTLDLSVVEARENQPEVVKQVWDYLALLVDEERIAEGKARLTQHDSLLRRLESEYGVDRHVIVALWGVESDYGRVLGERPLVQSLVTGSCRGGRRSFFTTQLVAALKIVDRGHLPGDRLVGSWAGAFGQTQFLPTTFLARAVDGDGDGQRDIVRSVPDALASAANYLVRAGWKRDLPWGYEVRAPAKLGLRTGRRAKRPIGDWRKAGVTGIDGERLSSSGSAALLEPAGRKGPAFLVTANFDALYSYNAAESYALAIGHLADRLRGEGPFVTAWPTDDGALSRDERLELQRLLIARGFDLGAVDGVIGARTQAAIRVMQKTLGLPTDGHAGRKLLEALRASAATGPTSRSPDRGPASGPPAPSEASTPG